MKTLLAARQDQDGRVEWKFDGVDVCRRGWKTLYAMGGLQ